MSVESINLNLPLVAEDKILLFLTDDSVTCNRIFHRFLFLSNQYLRNFITGKITKIYLF